MPSVQIKHVPPDVHAVLRRRAAAAGQSLQEYLLAEITSAAATPTLSEVLERVRHRSGGRLELAAAAADLEADRSRT